MKTLLAITVSLFSLCAQAEELGQGGTSGSLIDIHEGEACANCTSQSYGDFRDVIIKNWDKGRGLYAIPTDNTEGYQNSLCGSGHHRPDVGEGNKPLDTYTTALAGCVYMSILQEWKKNYCPNGGGCKISLGDVSHKFNPKFNGLKTHANGECYNVRPMQKDEFKDQIVSYGDESYDGDMTRKFIQLLRNKGVRVIMFNDPTTGAKRVRGLDNVINFCIRGSDAEQKTCKDFKYDESVCGAQGSTS